MVYKTLLTHSLLVHAIIMDFYFDLCDLDINIVGEIKNLGIIKCFWGVLLSQSPQKSIWGLVMEQLQSAHMSSTREIKWCLSWESKPQPFDHEANTLPLHSLLRHISLLDVPMIKIWRRSSHSSGLTAFVVFSAKLAAKPEVRWTTLQML
jgi:hypothetical protein